jgi:hypothetical protein
MPGARPDAGRHSCLLQWTFAQSTRHPLSRVVAANDDHYLDLFSSLNPPRPLGESELPPEDLARCGRAVAGLPASLRPPGPFPRGRALAEAYGSKYPACRDAGHCDGRPPRHDQDARPHRGKAPGPQPARHRHWPFVRHGNATSRSCAGGGNARAKPCRLGFLR